MNRRPVNPRIRTGEPREPEQTEAGLSREDFRNALSRWATGVTIVAVRDEDLVQATTVGSLTSISDRPPTVAISLTGSARILPFLAVGVPYGVSVLGTDQARLASVFADSFPVGPSPFDEGEAPLVGGALVGLRCRVTEITPVSGSFLVISNVEDVVPGKEGDPLVYFRRTYRVLDPLD